MTISIKIKAHSFSLVERRLNIRRLKSSIKKSSSEVKDPWAVSKIGSWDSEETLSDCDFLQQSRNGYFVITETYF